MRYPEQPTADMISAGIEAAEGFVKPPLMRKAVLKIYQAMHHACHGDYERLKAHLVEATGKVAEALEAEAELRDALDRASYGN